MIALLKSDRFGMEISFWEWKCVTSIVNVKIRPFRYGNKLEKAQNWRGKLSQNQTVSVWKFTDTARSVYNCFFVKIRPFRYGNCILTPPYNIVNLLLKSDRFGMEIRKFLLHLSFYFVKIRPFRYGNSTVNAIKIITLKLVKIRPFRYGNYTFISIPNLNHNC